jgi:hypothetical protein
MIIVGQEKDMARQGKKSSSSLSCNNKQTDRKTSYAYLIERLLQLNLGLYAYNSLHWVCMIGNYCRQCRYRLF